MSPKSSIASYMSSYLLQFLLCLSIVWHSYSLLSVWSSLSAQATIHVYIAIATYSYTVVRMPTLYTQQCVILTIMTICLPVVYYSCLCMHGLVRLPSLPSVLSSLLYTATIPYTYLVFIITASRMVNLCYYLVCLCYCLLCLPIAVYLAIQSTMQKQSS